MSGARQHVCENVNKTKARQTYRVGVMDTIYICASFERCTCFVGAFHPQRLNRPSSRGVSRARARVSYTANSDHIDVSTFLLSTITNQARSPQTTLSTRSWVQCLIKPITYTICATYYGCRRDFFRIIACLIPKNFDHDGSTSRNILGTCRNQTFLVGSARRRNSITLDAHDRHDVLRVASMMLKLMTERPIDSEFTLIHCYDGLRHCESLFLAPGIKNVFTFLVSCLFRGLCAKLKKKKTEKSKDAHTPLRDAVPVHRAARCLTMPSHFIFIFFIFSKKPVCITFFVLFWNGGFLNSLPFIILLLRQTHLSVSCSLHRWLLIAHFLLGLGTYYRYFRLLMEDMLLLRPSRFTYLVSQNYHPNHSDAPTRLHLVFFIFLHTGS